MKFLPSQLLFFFQNKTTRKNLTLLAKFIAFILTIVVLYSLLFHKIMLYEGREYSWVTGLYWTLTVMSTLGFGDITFSTDLGLLFSIVVLSSGVMLLLIMLPFTFIQFFYSPWLEAQSKSRTPRELPENTSGHIIITSLDPITEKLIAKLRRRAFQYVLIVAELQQAAELHDAGLRVVVGEPDDPETYHRLRVENAAMVVATSDDMINTSVAFTVRETSRSVPIVTSANHENSLDILQFPGNIHVFQFARMLGRALGSRTIGLGRPVNFVISFDKLHVAEIPAIQTRLCGKNLIDIGMREKTGVTVVGLWEKGMFHLPRPETVISATTLLLLVGTERQLGRFEDRYAIREGMHAKDAPVLVLGGGRVGVAVVETLEEHGISYRVVEKRAAVTEGKGEGYIRGDAADIKVLERAGVMEARTIIITTHNDAMNIYLAFYCRQLRPQVQIISRATNERSVAKLHMAGADLVLSYASMGANAIINVLKSDEISMFTEGLNIFRRPMPASLVGKNLVASHIRQRTGCSVIAIKSSGDMIVSPDPTVALKKNEELILIGTTEAEKAFLDLF